MNRLLPAWMAPLCLLAGASLHGAEEPQLPLYVGPGVCHECHGKPGVTGSARPCAIPPVAAHRSAAAALHKPEAAEIALLSGIGRDPMQSTICLGCHAAAAEEGPRWTAATFNSADGVQCESCHGAGSLHVNRRRAGGMAAAMWHRHLAGEITGWKPVPHGHATRRDFLPLDGRTCNVCHRVLPSHRMVLDQGFHRKPADTQYQTPVNLAISPDGSRLYVACEHADTVLIIDPAAGRLLGDVRVGRRPHDLAVSPDGGVVYVTNRLSDTVSVIDAAGGAGFQPAVVAEIPVGNEPHGLLLEAGGRRLLVLNTGENSISVIDTGTRTETKRLAAGQGPWSAALAPDGRTIYATSVRPDIGGFREPYQSEITVLDGEAGVVSGRLPAAEANMLKGIACVPAGPHRGVALFVLMRTKNLVPATRVAQGWVITNGLGVLWPDGRVDQVLLDDPAAGFPDPEDVAISPDGRYALVTSGGSNQAAVVDVDLLLETIAQATTGSVGVPPARGGLPNHLGLSHRFVRRRLDVGVNPRGAIFAPDGRRAYVANALDDSLTVIETAGLSVQSAQSADVIETGSFQVVGRIDLGGPREVTELRSGERAFHDARISFGRQFSCQSCHPDGHYNGLAIDIEAEGIGLKPVDNRTLRGIFDTGPFKWEGTNPTLNQQCGPRFAVFFTRRLPPPPERLEPLVRYISTIERPPNRYRPQDGLTTPQYRGKLVFERVADNYGRPLAPEQRCASCHNGPYKTAQTKTTVRSTMVFDEQDGLPPGETGLPDAGEFGNLGIYFFGDTGVRPNLLDIPHLNNIYDSPPYLHNGAAATLEEIWTRFNFFEAHGLTRDLTRRQFNDLMAYLRAL